MALLLTSAPFRRSFGVGKLLEDGARAVLDRIRQPAAGNEAIDLSRRQGNPHFPCDGHVHLCRVQCPTRHLLFRQLISINLQCAERTRQILEREPGIHQGTQHHIAADSGETIEMQMPSHAVILISLTPDWRPSYSTPSPGGNDEPAGPHSL